jgi:hypothetical protein
MMPTSANVSRIKNSAIALRMMFPKHTNKKLRAFGETSRLFSVRIPSLSRTTSAVYVFPAFGPSRRTMLRCFSKKLGMTSRKARFTQCG